MTFALQQLVECEARVQDVAKFVGRPGLTQLGMSAHPAVEGVPRRLPCINGRFRARQIGLAGEFVGVDHSGAFM